MAPGGTPTDAVVRTRGLSKRYGRQPALVDVDLEVAAGEVFGYLGPNGAGKTTTMRILLGLLRPTAGSATVFGLDAWTQSPQVHRRTGYLPGDAALYGKLTGVEHVRYFAALRSVGDVHEPLLLAKRLDLDLDRPARSLSRGNKQKLSLVLALIGHPELLVLDEPTSGLDPLVQQEFHALLREHTDRGGTVLLSSHVLDEVQRIADRVAIIRSGRLVAVERLAELRAKSLHHVRILFAQPVDPAPYLHVPGVRDVALDGSALTCSAPQPSLDAIVKLAAAHEVVDLECQEADLEETFLAYYGEEAGDAA